MLIPEYFSGKCVFLTGGTGFVGKALIEKLLRSCPDLENIYVLIRGKKNRSAQERLKGILNNPLFDVLKKTNPEATNKLIAIEGDVSELKLGISEKDWQLLTEKVNFIYHIAASVRFDDHLRDSIFVNVRSTREIIQLAYDAKDLMTFVYISTTYCNVDRGVVEERVYPAHGDWQEAIRVVEETDPNLLEILTQKYIEPMPNTYTYAKGLAEATVVDLCKGKIPSIIVRPSVVVSTYCDPVIGWNDNFNGPVGLLVAGGKGLLRITYGVPDSIQDYMPVDALTRVIISTTTEKCKTNDLNEIEVYNCSKYKKCPITIKQLVSLGAKLIDDVPFKEVLWYPRFSLTSCWYNYYIQVLLFHMIPAIFVDIILMLAGRKPMLFKVQRKIFIANSILYPFISQTWDFVNDNIYKLNEKISPEDRDNFGGEIYLNITNEEVYQFFRQAKIGTASYFFKEQYDRDLNRKLMKRRWMLDVAIKTVFGLIFCWYLFIRLNVARDINTYIQNYFV